VTRVLPRDRIAVPFWSGILSAIAAIAVGIAAAFIATILLIFIVVLTTGNLPSLTPGHPLVAATELIFYATAGWFAWSRLRAADRDPFRSLDGHDIRTILLGVAALAVVRIGTVVQLVITNQTKHVQTGFEHFDVVTKNPSYTALGVTLAVVAMVVLGPIVEEMIFRGLLFGAIAPRIGTVAGAILTALIFGFVHGDPVLFPTLAALGLVTALAYAATGNLWVPITLHILNNALGAAFLIGTSLQTHK
jgi:membrane protease YdiL (CAAX protease family)